MPVLALNPAVDVRLTMTPPLAHPPGRLPRPGVRAANVHVEHAVDEIVVGVDAGPVVGKIAGVVDPDLETAELGDGAIGRGGQRCGVGRRRARRRALAARRGQLVGDARRRRRPSRSPAITLGAGFGQATHDLRAETAAGAGDDGDADRRAR